MRKIISVFLLCLVTSGTALGDDSHSSRWINYFGIGAGVPIDNIPRDRSAMHMSGALAPRILPHVQLTLNLGYYPYGDRGTLVAFGDSYEIVTIGLGGKINTASYGRRLNGYLIFGGGIAALDNAYTKPFYAAGAGFETKMGVRIGVFIQGQYIQINDETVNRSIAEISAGISFTPL